MTFNIKKMKRNTRNSVFETNSSSTHSVHVDRRTQIKDTSLLPDEDGNIHIGGGEFGWEWRTYNDASTKADYVANSAAPEEILIQAIKEQTGAKEVFVSDGGYTDHQSSNALEEGGVNLYDVEDIKNWIFNPNCWLVTGNDNSSEPVNIFDFPVTDEKGDVHPYEYTHELRIKGINKTASFNDRATGERLKKAFYSVLEDVVFYEDGSVGHGNSWDSKEGEYYFETYENKNSINEEEKYFTVLCSYALRKDVEDTYELEKEEMFSKKIMTETDNPHETGKENPWQRKNEIKERLLKKEPEKYTKRIDYEIVEIGK
jgi:hypothetical protein